MLVVNSFIARSVRHMAVVAIAFAAVATLTPNLEAQVFERSRSVGGISVNADGVLENAQIDDTGKLARVLAESMEAVPTDLSEMTPMRKISLRRLDAAIAKSIASGEELPDEIKYLAGLQQIRYVLVYPELNDVVLVGPGEGWKVDKRGNVVGITTGRPVMLLDDLLTALRSAQGAARNPISCSIDPTKEGLTRLQAYASKLRTIGNPQQTAAGIAKVLGPQNVTFTGVADDTHFARVLVAADYRMKRLAMNFEKSPVKGLPSFLSMMQTSRKGMNNMLPRWWLEPNYEPVLRSEDGLAWELRGAGVKAMTEEDFLSADGGRKHTGKANPVAQKWADNMTSKFDELAVADPIFGQMRNCMELAIVSALITKEGLLQKAGSEMTVMMDGQKLETESFPAPKHIDSQASVLKQGRNWIISASGGVQLNSWAIAHKTEVSSEPAKVRAEVVAGETKNWWWN